MTIAETFKLAGHLNPHWNEGMAAARIETLGLKLSQKVGKLSGGQQAQVALTLALAKEPELLMLDEPVASLDPMARREFLNAVLEAAADEWRERDPLLAHRRRAGTRLRLPGHLDRWSSATGRVDQPDRG